MTSLKVFVGTDRSQALAVKVLEHSIKTRTTAHVEVIPMCDLPIPVPKDIKNQQRTGFSFSRFCIPKFMNYQDKAVYMDADMQVFTDIRELFNWPMDSFKIAIQSPLQKNQSQNNKSGAPKKRIRQCSVMLIDCQKVNWNIDQIINDLDTGKYNYDQLMKELCILEEHDIGEVLPFEWNSLEHYDAGTRLIHYTDMNTQPWVSTRNKNGYLWYNEIRSMLADGSLTLDEVRGEIKLGFFRPSLIVDIQHHHKVPAVLKPLWNTFLSFADRVMGFKAHKEVYLRTSQIRKAQLTAG